MVWKLELEVFVFVLTYLITKITIKHDSLVVKSMTSVMHNLSAILYGYLPFEVD